MIAPRKNVRPFRYVEAEIPFYPPSSVWGRVGQPLRRMQLPLEPAEALQHYVYPVGFELKLFASEPDLGGKPIAITWDERGRLWVAVTVDYPNDLQPEGQGHDRIVICEDTDGDGRADRFQVFAERLSIPTSILRVHDGVLVHQAPHTLFLRDRDGDDRADERHVVFTGWSTADTHAGPSNLRYGLDNWIWGIVGYSGFQGTLAGELRRFQQGLYRFRADGRHFEFMRSTSNNSWGVGISEEGLVFGSTANGCPSVYVALTNRYYEKVRGWSAGVLTSIAESNRFYPITDKVRQVDFHGGFTAAAGHALYTARTYPSSYWNKTAFVCEPTGHLVATFVLQPQGTDFRARYGWNLAASDDEWAAPIVAEVGPDGMVWIVDWYNIIVQHNPTPPGYRTGRGNAYETPLRDKSRGRIYRLVYTEARSSRVPDLSQGSVQACVQALAHDNMFWRLQGQRLLVERQRQEAIPHLLRLLADRRCDELGLDPPVIHALWTLHGLGAIRPDRQDVFAAVIACLKHPSAGVRRAAASVLPPVPQSLDALLDAGVVQDAHPLVQLAALCALADMPCADRAGSLLAQLLTDSKVLQDRWLPDALTAAAAQHAGPFLIGSCRQPLSGKALDILARVAAHVARGGETDSIEPLVAATLSASAPVRQTILTALADHWPRGKKVHVPAQRVQQLLQRFANLETRSQFALVRLARLWGMAELEKYAADLTDRLAATIADDKVPAADRIAIARELLTLRPDDAQLVSKIVEQVSPMLPAEQAKQWLDILTQADAQLAADAILSRLIGWTPSLRMRAVGLLLDRPACVERLLQRLERGDVPIGDLSLDQRQRLTSYPDGRLAQRAQRLLARGGALPSTDRAKVIEELRHVVSRPADGERGQVVFKQHCAKCHSFFGEGEHIGPDLTGMAVHTKEHLLTEILDPNRSVEGNYRMYVLELKNGQVLAGLLGAETRTTLELVDAEGRKHIVQRDDIEQITASPKSLMPEGFEKQLSADDLAHLLAFLTRPRRYIPLPLEKVATVVTTRGMFYDENASGERLVFDDWTPKLVGGVPFHLVDPRGDRVPNAILLYAPQGTIPPRMPKQVTVPIHMPVRALHFLSGVSGWGFPWSEKGSVTMTVRLRYADGVSEDHELYNGIHFADYIRRVDVPGSRFAFAVRGRQMRYFAIEPRCQQVIEELDLIKGPDQTAPVIMAITVERPQ